MRMSVRISRVEGFVLSMPAARRIWAADILARLK